MGRPPLTKAPLFSSRRKVRRGILSQLVGFEKHLLVDGSNVMHAWPELRQLLKRDRDAARAKLSQALALIHDHDEIRVTLVFDGRGPELAVERPSSHVTFS